MADEALRILRRNEKAKAWSTVIANLGSALIASAFGRWWLVGFDPWVTIWGVSGSFMVLFSVELLNLLEAEN